MGKDGITFRWCGTRQKPRAPQRCVSNKKGNDCSGLKVNLRNQLHWKNLFSLVYFYPYSLVYWFGYSVKMYHETTCARKFVLSLAILSTSILQLIDLILNHVFA